MPRSRGTGGRSGSGWIRDPQTVALWIGAAALLGLAVLVGRAKFVRHDAQLARSVEPASIDSPVSVAPRIVPSQLPPADPRDVPPGRDTVPDDPMVESDLLIADARDSEIATTETPLQAEAAADARTAPQQVPNPAAQQPGGNKPSKPAKLPQPGRKKSTAASSIKGNRNGGGGNQPFAGAGQPNGQQNGAGQNAGQPNGQLGAQQGPAGFNGGKPANAAQVAQNPAAGIGGGAGNSGLMSNLTSGLAAAAVSAGIALTASTDDSQSSGVTPVNVRYGWHPTAAKAASPTAAAMPQFKIDQTADHTKSNVRLYKYLQTANGGVYPTNIPQQTGDCPSWGTKHAVETLEGVQIASGNSQEVHLVFAPHIYGGARVTIARGILGHSQGACVEWTTAWIQQDGVLKTDLPGVPAYSGQLADQWGYSGVPANWVQAGKAYPVKTRALVRTATEVRDAICNGYPVITGSDAFGSTSMGPQDGRIVAVNNTSWPHAMHVDAYDGSAASGKKYFHIYNSWGPDAHPKPIDDSPPGGFWIQDTDMDKMAQQEDTWAISGFTGFPAQPHVLTNQPQSTNPPQ